MKLYIIALLLCQSLLWYNMRLKNTSILIKYILVINHLHNYMSIIALLLPIDRSEQCIKHTPSES